MDRLPLDLKIEILINLDCLKLDQILQLPYFQKLNNNENFWQRYSEKWKINKVAITFKSSVKLYPILDFLIDFAPFYTKIMDIEGEYRGPPFEVIFDNDIERINFIKNKGYQMKYDSQDKCYFVDKPIEKYMQDKNLIIPYAKIVLLGHEPIKSSNIINSFIIIGQDRVILDKEIKGHPIIAADILKASLCFMHSCWNFVEYIKYVKDNGNTLTLRIGVL
jgi:hypothetical protein